MEGYEKEVLLGMNWDYRPHVFIIESTEPRTNTPTYYKWEGILLENGYKYVLSNGVNRFYVDINMKNNLKFLDISELLNKYDVRYSSKIRYVKNMVKNPKIIPQLLFYVIKHRADIMHKY